MNTKINKEKLLLAREINTDEFGTLYFPTVQYLINNGEDGFNRLVSPFALTLDILDLSEEALKEIKVFDLFFQNMMLTDDISYYDALMKSLEYYFRMKPIYNGEFYCICMVDNNLWNEHLELVKDLYYTDRELLAKYMDVHKEKYGEEIKIIHRDNFDNLSDIILQISRSQKIEVEKIPKFENDIQKDVYFKVKEGRRRKAEKNKISFATMIKVAMNGANNYISAKEVSNMTINQLIDRYEFIISKDDWDMNFDKYLVGADPKDLDLTYWVYKVKI